MDEYDRLDDEIVDLELIADDWLDTKKNSIANKALDYLHDARNCLAFGDLEGAKKLIEKARALLR